MREKVFRLMEEVEIGLMGKLYVDRLSEKEKEVGNCVSEYIDSVINQMKGNIERSKVRGEDRVSQFIERMEYLGIK